MPLLFRVLLFVVGVPAASALLWSMYRSYQEDRPVSSKVADHPAGSFMYYFYYLLFVSIVGSMLLCAAILPFLPGITDK